MTIQKITDEFAQNSANKQKAIQFSVAKAETTGLTDSKIGGNLYFPKSAEYPHGKNSKQPLRFLAQLNFSQLPKLENFPQSGLLQFFIAQEDVYGADFDNPTSQDGFRVLYHKDTSEETMTDIPVPDDDCFPFGENEQFALTAELTEMTMTPGDFRFDEAFLKVYKKYYPDSEAEDVFDIADDDVEGYDAEKFEEVYNNLCKGGCRVGGYPYFTQSDPRGDTEELQNHTVLLLQIDSEDEIMWGDCGVANFFITPDDLANLDFSNVLYNWDCG